MKKILTLLAFVLTAFAVNAQNEPLYTFSTTITNDAEWGDDYASAFAFQGTKVNVEVYAEDYIIIRNWAGAEGCDLKIEYDPSIDVSADDCMGNITAVTAYINGEEQEALSYQKTEKDEETGTEYTYTYLDFATGREDYSVCSTTLNEDGTLYWSFIELDKEEQVGYVELTGYFMSSDYSKYMDETYYFVEWPETATVPEEPGFYGTFDAAVASDYDEGATSFPEVAGIRVDAYNDHIVVHNLAGVAGYDMTITFDEEENVLSITPPTKTGEEGKTVTNGWCSIYTGLDDDNWNKFQAYLYPDYCFAGADEESGYVLLYGYDNTGSIYGYYYIYWGETEEEDPDAIAAIKATANGTVFSLAGQRVSANYKGIVIKDGVKQILK